MNNEKALLFKIESLRTTITELSDHCAKKSLRRLLIILAVISLILICIMGTNADKIIDFLYIIPFSIIFSVCILFVTYCISSFTFTKAKHETMIIEKLKTELSILTNEPECDIDMVLEIGKLRDLL